MNVHLIQQQNHVDVVHSDLSVNYLTVLSRIQTEMEADGPVGLFRCIPTEMAFLLFKENVQKVTFELRLGMKYHRQSLIMS